MSPYKVDTNKLIIPKEKGFDRRYKLSEQEKDEIRENMDGLSQRKLAFKYNVDRRTIGYVINPERYLEILASNKQRGRKQYYDKTRNREAVKSTRHYRHELLNPNPTHRWTTLR